MLHLVTFCTVKKSSFLVLKLRNLFNYILSINDSGKQELKITLKLLFAKMHINRGTSYVTEQCNLVMIRDK